MDGGIVEGSIVPTVPEHTYVRTRKHANAVRVIAIAEACASIDVYGSAGGHAVRATVAGEADYEAAVLFRFEGHGVDIPLGGKLRFVRRAFVHAIEMCKRLCDQGAAADREGYDELAVSGGTDRVLNGRGERDQLRAQALKDRVEATHKLVPGIDLQITGTAGDGGARSVEKSSNFGLTTIALLDHKHQETPLAQPSSALQRGRASAKGERNWRIDLAADLCNARPQRLQQASSRVSECRTLVDRVIAHAHDGARRPNLGTPQLDVKEAMAIGAQNIGKRAEFARIALASPVVTKTRELWHVGTIRYDTKTSVRQHIYEQIREQVDRDVRKAHELPDETPDTLFVVPDFNAKVTASCATKPPDGERPLCPAKNGKALAQRYGRPPGGWSKSSHTRRRCRKLIERRSGFSCQPQQSVARLSRPISSMRRVARGPSGRRAASGFSCLIKCTEACSRQHQSASASSTRRLLSVLLFTRSARALHSQPRVQICG